MVLNALAGTAAGYSLDLTPAEIKAGIEGLPMMPGRNNIISTDKLVILDDCYNANPVSMKAAMNVLNLGIGRKVAVVGNMGELGENAYEMHYDTGKYAAELGLDVVCAIGELGKGIAEGAKTNEACEVHWFETTEDFLAASSEIIKDGDNVLVKASHSMHLEKVVDALANK